MLQNTNVFNEDLRDLGVEIHQLLSCLAEVQDRAKIIYLKDTVVAIMKAISEASVYVKEYIERNALGRLD